MEEQPEISCPPTKRQNTGQFGASMSLSERTQMHQQQQREYAQKWSKKLENLSGIKKKIMQDTL